MNLEEFLEEIKPSIKWSSSTGYHRCSGCGRQMDSSEKLTHWPKYCSLSKNKKLQKLRTDVIAENFPEKEKPALQEVGIEWYQNQVRNNANLPIDFKPTGSLIDETLYPSTQAKQLSSKDLQYEGISRTERFCQSCYDKIEEREKQAEEAKAYAETDPDKISTYGVGIKIRSEEY